MVARGKIHLLEHDGTVKWGPIAIPGGTNLGGMPTVGDMDNDGSADIGVPGRTLYTLFSASGSVKWSTPIIENSDVTGSTSFDFDGDGKLEVLYGDTEKLRIHRGSDGHVLWETVSPSGTLYEMPVIADVDADGRADIVSVVNEYLTPGHTGIRVYSMAADTWVSTRRIWNQVAYSVTNVNDDATIPARPANNWTGSNTFRANTIIKGCLFGRPDLAPSFVRVRRSLNDIVLTARIGNGGIQIAGPDVHVSFYSGNPASGGTLLGSVRTPKPVEPGTFQDVSLTKPRATAASPLWIVADDDGTGAGRIAESDEQNNAYDSGIVLAENQAPLADAGPNANVVIGESVLLSGMASDDGLPLGGRLTVRWSQVAGPGTVTFLNAAAGTTEAIFPVPGTYDLRFEASDGLLTSIDFVTVVVSAHAPLTGAQLAVTTMPGGGPVPIGNTLFVVTWVRDNGGAAMANIPVRLTITGAHPRTVSLVTDATGFARHAYDGVKTGTDSFSARVSDSFATITATAPSITWAAPGAGGSALLTQGWIASPIHQSQVAGIVPVVLGGTATLVSGHVDTWPMQDPTAIRTLATGVSGAPGATLASLDTSTLVNGTHVIRLLATNTQGATVDSRVAVTIVGEYKPGRVRMELTDMTVPLAGLPITVGRVYDSLERGRVGDFGHGWNLALGGARIDKDPAHNVTLTMPGGRRASFFFTPISFPGFFGFLFSPLYTPETGVFGTLTAEGACTLLVQSEGRLLCFPGISTPYAPTGYTYKDPYGTTFAFDSNGRYRSITDLQGNTLTFAVDGITSSAGDVRVAFERDGSGRITKITGPDGTEHGYQYNAAGDLVSVALPGGGQHMYTYSAGHFLQTAVDAEGRELLRTTYNADGRLASVRDGEGHVTSYSYDIAAGTTTVSNPDSGQEVQRHDTRGRLLSTTDPLGRTTTYTYNALGLKVTEKNAANETTTFEYDAAGRETLRRDAANRTWRTTYSAFGQVLTSTNPAGTVFTIDYEDGVRPSVFRDSLGTVARFSSTPQGLPSTITDALGATATRRYDERGDLVTSVDRLGRTTTYEHDAMGRVLVVRDPRGSETRTAYTPLGQVASETDAAGTTRTFAYDKDGRLVRENRPGTIAFRQHTYDAAGRLARIKNADGTSRTFSYDFRGNPLTETDEGGRTTSFEYDLAGQLVKRTHADGSIVRWEYDAIGRQTAMVDERGGRTTYEYDTGCGCARVTKTTDPLGRATTKTYDNLGRLTSTTDAAGRRTSYQYDVRGRLLTTTNPDMTTIRNTYDAAGRLLTVTDQSGAVTSYGYDAEGQLVKVTDAIGGVTQYAYDGKGNLTRTTDPNGHVTLQEHDLLGRQTKRTLPMGMSERFTYDVHGNQVSRTDFRGRTTTFQYDVMDRLTRRVPDPAFVEPSVAFTYTPTGQRASMTDVSGATTYSYDARNRLLTKATPAGILNYTYDASGNVASIRSSNANGVDVSYAWDAANQLTSVTDNRDTPAMTVANYGLTGMPATVTQPSGVQASYSYDTLDRVLGLSWQQGTQAPFASYTYTLGPAGHRLSVTDASGRRASYTYDRSHRLTGETVTGAAAGGDGSVQYVLDPFGNRLRRTSTLAGVPSANYSYDANDRFVGDGYDANGNTVSMDGATFAYDSQDRLVSKNGGQVTYLYDGDGARVGKTVGGVMTLYLVDDLNATGYSQVLEEVSGGAVQRRYTFGSKLISQSRNVGGGEWATSHYGYDAHGNVTFLTDGAGVVTDTYAYDAFGNLVASTGETPNEYLYNGQRWDGDLGMYHLRARHYWPGGGRFLTRDSFAGSLGEPLSLHRYLYGNSDPANRTDPSGLFSTAPWSPPSTTPPPTRSPGRQGVGGAAGEYVSIAAIITGALVGTTTTILLGRPDSYTRVETGTVTAVGDQAACQFYSTATGIESLLLARVSEDPDPTTPPPPFHKCKEKVKPECRLRCTGKQRGGRPEHDACAQKLNTGICQPALFTAG